MHSRRWKFLVVRRKLRPLSRVALDRWIASQAGRLSGLVVNVGSGEDDMRYGRRVVRVDAFAPSTTVCADLACGLPFRSSAFDSAVCTEVLEHVPDARFLLDELSRVVTPGGALLISVPLVFPYHADPEDYMRFTHAGLSAELARAGFAVETMVCIGGRLSALALWAESVHPFAKLVLRLAAFVLRHLVRSRPLEPPSGSPWAQHVAAVARRTSR